MLSSVSKKHFEVFGVYLKWYCFSDNYISDIFHLNCSCVGSICVMRYFLKDKCYRNIYLSFYHCSLIHLLWALAKVFTITLHLNCSFYSDSSLQKLKLKVMIGSLLLVLKSMHKLHLKANSSPEQLPNLGHL